jgi:hypothetical protein
MSHCPQCKKLMRGVCRFCQPQEYIDVVHQAFMDLADELTQRTWVGLTDEEIKAFDTWHDNREEEVGWVNPSEIVAYIEAKLKEKNT